MVNPGHPTSAVRRVRDLLYLDPGGPGLVIACDSLGGIGPKPSDSYACPGAVSAHFAARVPLLEVLCAGARPIALVDALCVEADPTGTEMIDAIRMLAAEAGIPSEAVTGSTEENVPTVATGIGVTVIGVRLPGLPSPGAARPGDVVLCAGLPLSAPDQEVTPGHPDIVAMGDLTRVLASGLVHDALPVGSRGIGYEGDQLAATAGLAFRAAAGPNGPDPTASAGPSTCVLLGCASAEADAVAAMFPQRLPVTRIGVVEAAGGVEEGQQLPLDRHRSSE